MKNGKKPKNENVKLHSSFSHALVSNSKYKYGSDSLTLDSGDYDLYLRVYYTANSVSTTVSGTVTITFKYPE